MKFYLYVHSLVEELNISIKMHGEHNVKLKGNLWTEWKNSTYTTSADKTYTGRQPQRYEKLDFRHSTHIKLNQVTKTSIEQAAQSSTHTPHHTDNYQVSTVHKAEIHNVIENPEDNLLRSKHVVLKTIYYYCYNYYIYI